MKKVIICFLDNESRKQFKNVRQFAQNLFGEWEFCGIYDSPVFEHFGGGYGLCFYEKSNEDFLKRLKKISCLIVRCDEEKAWKIYGGVFPLYIPYFRTCVNVESIPVIKDRISLDGEILKCEGNIYLSPSAPALRGEA